MFSNNSGIFNPSNELVNQGWKLALQNGCVTEDEFSKSSEFLNLSGNSREKVSLFISMIKSHLVVVVVYIY